MNPTNNAAPRKGRPPKPKTIQSDPNASTEQIGTDYVKKTKMKPRGGNSPIFDPNAIQVEPGDNSAMLSKFMELYLLEPVKTDAETEARIIYYFDWCISRDIRPTVEGMSLALGIDRTTLWKWEHGESMAQGGSCRSNIVKKAKFMLNTILSELGANGKINPVTLIFWQKNHYGYQDKTDIVITPNAMLGETDAPEQIVARQMDALPESD